jgi:hypothetical protein
VYQNDGFVNICNNFWFLNTTKKNLIIICEKCEKKLRRRYKKIDLISRKNKIKLMHTTFNFFFSSQKILNDIKVNKQSYFLINSFCFLFK